MIYGLDHGMENVRWVYRSIPQAYRTFLFALPSLLVLSSAILRGYGSRSGEGGGYGRLACIDWVGRVAQNEKVRNGSPFIGTDREMQMEREVRISREMNRIRRGLKGVNVK